MTGPTTPPQKSRLAVLVRKWHRDSDLAVADRCLKAYRMAVEMVWARAFLRRGELGPGVRVVGRPRVAVHGRLVIGPRCVLRSLVARVELYVAPGAEMRIGEDTHINSGATISSLLRVEIGDRVEIAPHVTIHDNSYHDLYDRNRVPASRPVVVEDDVWLATGCTVLPGVRIGRGAVVSANSLVTRDVEPFTVVTGVPAQVVKRLEPTRFVVRAPD